MVRDGRRKLRKKWVRVTKSIKSISIPTKEKIETIIQVQPVMKNTIKLQNSMNGKSNDEDKNKFLVVSITLRKLQEKQIIPKNSQPITLQASSFQYKKAKKDQKVLLLSQKNKVYYGQVNAQGRPESNKSICIFPDGSYYTGHFSNGQIQGQGTLTNLQESFSYEGNWKNGLPHGEGEEKIGTDKYDRYVGQFHMGKKHGFGKLYYGDGSRYEGKFNMGNIEGDGRYYNKNHFWNGQWKNGYLEGSGKQIIAKKNVDDLTNASEYEGNFVKGERSGQGKFVWNGKYEYNGHFKNGQLDGEGTFKFKGKVYAGTWAQGTELRIAQIKKNVLSSIEKK